MNQSSKEELKGVNNMAKKDEYKMFVKARQMMNYFKGEVLPFINHLCRRDMTTGDLDGFIFDYNKKVYYALEQKRGHERHRKSQDLHLKFLQTILDTAKKDKRFSDWNMKVYKVIGDPPFYNAQILGYPFTTGIDVTQDQMIDFFNLNVTYEDLIPKYNEEF